MNFGVAASRAGVPGSPAGTIAVSRVRLSTRTARAADLAPRRRFETMTCETCNEEERERK